jgi:hypothetical protein
MYVCRQCILKTKIGSSTFKERPRLLLTVLLNVIWRKPDWLPARWKVSRKRVTRDLCGFQGEKGWIALNAPEFVD